MCALSLYPLSRIKSGARSNLGVDEDRPCNERGRRAAFHRAPRPALFGVGAPESSRIPRRANGWNARCSSRTSESSVLDDGEQHAVRASMTIESARAHLKCLPSGLFTVLGLSFVKFQELLVEAEKVYVREVCAAARALGTFGDDLLPLLEEDFRRFAPAARVFRGASRCAEELCRGLGDEEAVRSAVQELLLHVQGCYSEVCPWPLPPSSGV
jgi:hypothetical protein